MLKLAVGNVSSTSANEFLHTQATVADAASETWVPLAQLWHELVEGTTSVVTTFFTKDRCYLVVRAKRDQSDCLTQRHREILLRMLLGEAQKVIAMDLCLSASSVASAASQTLHFMGVNCSVTRAPLPIVMAAHAQFGGQNRQLARQAMFEWGALPCRVMSVALPDDGALSPLSGAERSIVRLLLERHSNAEIARLRATSERTVANQLASIFRKRLAGSRCALISQLVAALPSAPAPGFAAPASPPARRLFAAPWSLTEAVTSNRSESVSSRPAYMWSNG